MDDVDAGQIMADQILKFELQHRAKTPTLVHTGFCHNCEEVLEGILRWCDHECEADWSAREASYKNFEY